MNLNTVDDDYIVRINETECTGQIPSQTYSVLLSDWKLFTDPIKEKLETKHFKELIEVCNRTYEHLHGEGGRAAIEILDKPGYESIFGLRKAKVL